MRVVALRACMFMMLARSSRRLLISVVICVVICVVSCWVCWLSCWVVTCPPPRPPTTCASSAGEEMPKDKGKVGESSPILLAHKIPRACKRVLWKHTGLRARTCRAAGRRGHRALAGAVHFLTCKSRRESVRRVTRACSDSQIERTHSISAQTLSQRCNTMRTRCLPLQLCSTCIPFQLTQMALYSLLHFESEGLLTFAPLRPDACWRTITFRPCTNKRLKHMLLTYCL